MTASSDSRPPLDYDDLAAALAAAPASAMTSATPMEALVDWRTTTQGALVVVLGDAGVGSVAAYYAALTDCVRLADRHLHRWRERLQLAAQPLDPDRFTASLDGLSLDHGPQAALIEGVVRLAQAAERDRIVIDHHAPSLLASFPADLVLVATADDLATIGDRISTFAGANTRVVMAPQRESVADAVRAAAAEAGATLIEVAASCKMGKFEIPADGQRFTIETPDARHAVTIPAIGQHQRANFALALLAAGEVDAGGIASRLSALRLPGCFESIKTSPRVIVDIGQSRTAYRALERTLHETRPAALHVLTTLDGGTDVESLTETLTSLSAPTSVAFHPNDRTIADSIARQLRERGLPVQLAGRPGPALEQLVAAAAPRDTILVFGARRPTIDARSHLLALERDPG